MDKATRLQYLEAMGIAVWEPRQRPIAERASADNVGWTSPSEAHQGIAESQTAARLIQPSAVALTGGHKHDAPPATMADAPPVPHQPKPRADDQVWHDLQHQVSLCRACPLCETRTQTVFGVGNRHASWMLIGEAPGQNEDLQGEPFVGKAGQLLNEMLRAIGLARQEVFIGNVLKCRPPANRDPQAEEVAACHDFLQRQIALLQPKIILAVGRIAAQNLLNTQQPLAKLRGIQHRLENIPLVVVHHPAYLLRALTEKAKAWDDLQFALSVYQSLQEQ